MDNLLLIQFSSMLLTFFVGLMLAMSRVHMTTIVRRYEVSRWMLVSAMLIYSVHFFFRSCSDFALAETMWVRS